jgi:DHA1 family inner membrane transport protein
MAFFRNRAINLLNLHYGIHCITLYGGGVVLFGLPAAGGVYRSPGVLGSLALILVGRFALRPLVIRCCATLGVACDARCRDAA